MASSPTTTSTTPPPTASEAPTDSAIPSSGPWQAIFSPQYNAYYFFNSETQETTWQNPLVNEDTQPAATEAESPDESQPSGSSLSTVQQAAIAQGIDPALAYLDPTLALPASATPSMSYGSTAKFNARTGQFTRPDARDPTHLSEYERAKRMSEFYFDVGAWEKQRARDTEAEEAEAAAGKKRKRPTKKDLVCSLTQFLIRH